MKKDKLYDLIRLIRNYRMYIDTPEYEMILLILSIQIDDKINLIDFI